MKPETGASASRKRQQGYSLVELLVAGSLATLIVSAVVAAVSAGTELSTSDSDRRQARSIARSVLEKEFDYKLYNSLPEQLTTSESVTINMRGDIPLVGELIKHIETDTMTIDNGKYFPVKNISVVVKWNITAETGDSITLQKIIARIL